MSYCKPFPLFLATTLSIWLCDEIRVGSLGGRRRGKCSLSKSTFTFTFYIQELSTSSILTTCTSDITVTFLNNLHWHSMLKRSQNVSEFIKNTHELTCDFFFSPSPNSVFCLKGDNNHNNTSCLPWLQSSEYRANYAPQSTAQSI